MKRVVSILCAFLLVISMCGCSEQKSEYVEKEISATQLQKKINNKKSFVFIVERENCEYCEALEKYIKQTKDEHPGLVLYKLDSTDFGFSKISEDSKQLKSDTEDGNILLNIAPYFLYTPSIYVIQNGKATHSAIGYDSSTNEVSLWDMDSTVDFDTADTQNFWEFLETYE